MTQYMTCPEGGTFFACTSISGGFVGCCNAPDACTPQGCGDGSLLPAGINNTAIGGQVYSKLHDQKCSTPNMQFWSCNATQPTFWGCCLSNPCSNDGICPDGNFSGAYLDANPADWTFFTQTNESSQPTTISSSSSPKATAISGAAGAEMENKSSSNVGGIVGGAVGGLVVLVAVIAGFWWCIKSRQRREAREQSTQHPEVRYSAAPTLVPSDYLGSPSKSTTGGSPDPNQFSYNTPPMGGPSPYHSGTPENFFWSHQQYQHPAMASPEPAWRNSTGYHPPQVAEIGGVPVYSQNEMPAE